MSVQCGWEGCSALAVTALKFDGIPDPLHVHNCSAHEAENREWSAVRASAPIGDACPWPCSVEPVLTVVPPELA